MATHTPLRPRSALAPRLRIMEDARPHLTPFRRRVVRLMCATAAGELGGRLKTATLSFWRSYEEEEADTLVLTLEADAEYGECHEVFQGIVRAFVQAGGSWTEAQWEDCRRIDFEVVPFRP